MAMTLATVGVNYLTRVALGIVASGGYNLHLFVNNYQPAVGDTVASYTECALTGYPAGGIALVPTTWTGSSTTGVATYTYPSQQFSFASYTGTAVTIYGYYITDSTNTILIGAEAFATPFTVPLGGGYVTVSLTWNEATY